MRIIFFGTSSFAVSCLKGLLDDGRRVVGVVTQPDRQGGRGGKKILVPPVKRFAASRKIELLQPENLNDSAVAEWIEARQPDILVVSAYGKLIPSHLIEAASHGAINPHPSLLPRFRGAAPIHWAVIRGDEVTGITTYFLDKKFDMGDIILQVKVPISPDETAGSLEEKLTPMAVELLVKSLDAVAAGRFSRTPQSSLENPPQIASAPEIGDRHRKLQWTWPSLRLLRRVRGLSPSPAAYTLFRDRRLKIFNGSVPDFSDSAAGGSVEPGEFRRISRALFIGTGDRLFLPTDVQLAGKRRMDWMSFANGARIVPGERLE